MKSKRMRKMINISKFYSEKIKGRGYLENVSVDRRLILKHVSKN